MTDLDRMPRGGPDASCLDRLLQTDRTCRVFGHHQQFAHLVLGEIADVPDPRILLLGAGHGELPALLRQEHPTAEVTATDLEPDAVAAIDAPGGHFALAVIALWFHRLPPAAAVTVLAEGTRVADKFLIIDLPRPPAPLHLLGLATMLPLVPFIPFVRDGVVSSLRSYSPSALRALADHADVDIELRSSLFGPQVAVATRR